LRLKARGVGLGSSVFIMYTLSHKRERKSSLFCQVEVNFHSAANSVSLSEIFCPVDGLMTL
jgi:hypothetical protein